MLGALHQHIRHRLHRLRSAQKRIRRFLHVLQLRLQVVRVRVRVRVRAKVRVINPNPNPST